MVAFYSEHCASSWEENFEAEEREGQVEKDRIRREREKTMKTGEQRRGAKKFSVAFWVLKRELEAEKSEIFIEIRRLFHSFSGRDCGESK